MRLPQERGSIPYSAVIQPLPLPLRKSGTISSMEAVQITLVLPNSIKHEPSAYLLQFLVIVMPRKEPVVLPSILVAIYSEYPFLA
jgi:hypothetical protein